MKFVIAGGGDVGLAICRSLLQTGHTAILIEKNVQLVQELCETLTIQVIAGDVTFFSTMQAIPWQQCDAFLAMTENDAVNLLSCTLAKTLGCPRTICRIHIDLQKELNDYNYQAHFAIDSLFNTQMSCAFAIAKLLRGNHRVVLEQLTQGSVELRALNIGKKSNFISKKVQDLPNFGIRIGFIQRKNEFFIPNRDTLLQENDRLTIAGDHASIVDFCHQADPHSDPVYITLFLTNEVSHALILLLQNPRFKIRIVEASLEKCQRMAEIYPHISVIHGDATQLSFLQEEQIQYTDYFIACSDNEEKNIIACLQAKKAGAKHTILWVNKDTYEDVCDSLASKLEVDHIISTQSCLWKDLQPLLFQQTFSKIETLEAETEHPIEIVEIQIPFGAKVEKLSLAQLNLPVHAVLLILKHKFRAKVPGAEDVLLGGDRIVAAVEQKDTDRLFQFLTQKTTLS